MMITEILTWKERQLKQDIVNAYLPVLPKLIKYFEACMEKKKATQAKPLVCTMDEKLYPVQLKSKTQKALVIQTGRNSYLITYHLTKTTSEITVSPFDSRQTKKIESLELLKNEKPNLEQVLANPENTYFNLAQYSQIKSSPVSMREYSQMYSINEQNQFLSTLEFMCMALADKGFKAADLTELYENFQPFFKEYRDFHEKRDQARKANPLPEFTAEMKTNLRAKFDKLVADNKK